MFLDDVKPQMIEKRYGHASAFSKNLLFCFAGSDEQGKEILSIEYLDTAKESEPNSKWQLIKTPMISWH